jgi:hypothetical protein
MKEWRVMGFMMYEPHLIFDLPINLCTVRIEKVPQNA